MDALKITPTSIADVLLIEPRVHQDERGFFFESYQKNRFAQAGIPFEFVQDNHSRSRFGTLRGLHYQIRQPQGKLLRVLTGEIFDVVVDLRKRSPTFGQWVGNYLSAGNKQILWVPPGFAHGFYVTSPEAEVLYKATDYYAPEWERAIRWNDPALGIAWPLEHQNPILSAKDATSRPFHEAEVYEELP